MVEAQSVRFAMTPFIWHTDCSVFVYKNGQATVDRVNLTPGKCVKVMVIGDKPNEAQVEAIKTLWQVFRDQFGFAVASFCPAIEPVMADIAAA